LYCKATNCQQGTCQPIPAEAGNKAPVCGCDGLTYWNSLSAGAHGMSLAKAGQCATGATCTSTAQCAAGQGCNIQVTSASDCATPNLTGQCWVLPATPPVTVTSAGVSSCDNKAVLCSVAYVAIQHGAPYYTDPTCPL
jgi:hypothetical protein